MVWVRFIRIADAVMDCLERKHFRGISFFRQINPTVPQDPFKLHSRHLRALESVSQHGFAIAPVEIIQFV